MNINNCPMCDKNILHEHFYQKNVTFYKYKNFEECLKEHLKKYRSSRRDNGYHFKYKCDKKTKETLYEEAEELYQRDRKENVGKIICRLITIDARKINTEEIEGFIKFIL